MQDEKYNSLYSKRICNSTIANSKLTNNEVAYYRKVQMVFSLYNWFSCIIGYVEEVHKGMI